MTDFYKATDKGNVLMLPSEVAVLQATQAEAANTKKDRNKARLLAAANDYVQKEVGEFGLSFATTGAALNRPKALATMKFVGSVWKEHTDRRALLDSGPPNLDFSNLGKAPFSTNELFNELKDIWTGV